MRRRLLIMVFAAIVIFSGLTAPAVSAASYGNINIINDSVMNKTGSMSAAQVQSFLNSFSGNCLGGGFQTPNPLGYSGGAYQYGGNVDGGTAIYNIANRYNLSPQVLLATLEKEQGLISRNGNCDYNNPASAPATYNGSAVTCGNGTTYTDCSFACQNTPVGGCVAVAVGYACPGFCKKSFNGFSKQLSGAAWVLRFAQARAYGQLNGYGGYDSGDEYISYGGPMTPGFRQRVAGGSNIYYDGSYTDNDGNTMYVTNGGTASMLNYTPFYARSYTSDKLFKSFFTRWFGNPANNSILGNSLGTNQLSNNTTMSGGDFIVSPNGKFVTVMQYDGNLVTYTTNFKFVWASNTSGNYGAYAAFQNDGNFVVYSSGNSALWNANTQNVSANNLRLGDDGNFNIYSSSALIYSTNIHVNNFATTYIAAQVTSQTTLRGGDYLKSPDGRFSLVMQADGNLVLYTAENTPLWHSSTYGNYGAYAVMQADGNLVVYSSSNRALWNSRTFGHGPSTLRIQNDGNLVIVKSGNIATWSSGTWQNNYQVNNYLGDQISSNTTLRPTDYLRSADWRYILVMQNDGNLVLFSANGYRPLWHSSTYGNYGAYAVMQADGNLVVYSSSNRALWNSRTFGHGPSVLKVQADGNLVIYKSGNIATWNSQTFGWF
ncbi:MAG: hypothetical protein WCF91_03515 [bacterium]